MKLNEKPRSKLRVKFLIVMATLIIIERGFMVSGIVSVPEQYLPPKLRKYHSIIGRVHLTLGLASYTSLLCSILCFLLFRAKTFADYVEVATFVVGTFIVMSFYASFAWQSSKISEDLANLKTTVEQRCHSPVLRSIYAKKEGLFSKVFNILWKIVFASIQLIVFPMALVSFHRYYTSDSSTNPFLLPFPCVFPWDWQRPVGYLAAICVQCYWANFGALLFLCLCSFFTLFCLFFEAFALDIKQSISDLNASVVSVDRKLTTSERLELKQRFSDIIQFHSHAKESIERFSNLTALPLTVIFVLSSTLMCTILLNLESAVEHPIDVLRMGGSLVLFVLCIALFCFFGQRVSTQFEEINDAIHKCSWERFPLEAQKLLPTMMILSQKPVHIHGHMNLRCSHEFLNKIINGTYSFFMVLRDFNF